MNSKSMPEPVRDWLVNATPRELAECNAFVERRMAEESYEATKDMKPKEQIDYCRTNFGIGRTHGRNLRWWGKQLAHPVLDELFSDERFIDDEVQELLRLVERTKITTQLGPEYETNLKILGTLKQILRDNPDATFEWIYAELAQAVRKYNAVLQSELKLRRLAEINRAHEELKAEQARARQVNADPVLREAGVDSVPYVTAPPPSVPPMRSTSPGVSAETEQWYVTGGVTRKTNGEYRVSLDGLAHSDSVMLEAAIMAEQEVVRSLSAPEDWESWSEEEKTGQALMRILWRGITGDGEVPQVNLNLNVDVSQLIKNLDLATVKSQGRILNMRDVSRLIHRYGSQDLIIVNDKNGELKAAIEADIPPALLKRIHAAKALVCAMPHCGSTEGLQVVAPSLPQHDGISLSFCPHHCQQVTNRPGNLVIDATYGAVAWSKGHRKPWEIDLFITPDSAGARALYEASGIDFDNPLVWSSFRRQIIEKMRKRLTDPLFDNEW
ncbi:MAG: hypothetical protein Q3972_03025 [Corynebacterium sp.]|nr:hypothetical protein [Corynebacterium sp.]